MRRIVSMVVGVAVLAALSGCFQPPRVIDDPDAPVSDPGVPAGWADFPPCPGGPPEPWVWVDGFPAAELEAAGYEPVCGATYLETESPAYTTVADPEVTLEGLEAIADELEAVGYELSGSTFRPKEPGDESGIAGTWEYSRPDPSGDEFVWIVNFWPGDGGPDTYYSYVDYEGPGTRILG